MTVVVRVSTRHAHEGSSKGARAEHRVERVVVLHEKPLSTGVSKT